MKSILLRLLCLAGLVALKTTAAYNQVVVNEYSCANLAQFTDDYGEYEDWIELYNPAAAAVNIEGYYLSDNPDNPTKFMVPSAVLVPANGYLLVIASGRKSGRREQRTHQFQTHPDQEQRRTYPLQQPGRSDYQRHKSRTHETEPVVGARYQRGCPVAGIYRADSGSQQQWFRLGRRFCQKT